MTDPKLQQLAREYAEQYPPFSDPDLTKADRNDMVETMTDYAVEILRWLAKTHCIVSRDTVTNLHRAISLSKKYHLGDEMYDKGALNVLDGLFGKSTFEERSEI